MASRRTANTPGPNCATSNGLSNAHYGRGTPHGDDIYEHGGFAVHFFPRALVDSLAEGWTLDEVEPLDEGDLPRRLWRITQTRPR